MMRPKNVLLGLLSLATIYSANLAYHSSRAFDAVRELARTNKVIRGCELAKARVRQEMDTTTVISTNDPAVRPELYFQNGEYHHIVRHGERSRHDDLGEDLREVGSELGQLYVDRMNLECSVAKHGRQRFTVF